MATTYFAKISTNKGEINLIVFLNGHTEFQRLERALTNIEDKIKEVIGTRIVNSISINPDKWLFATLKRLEQEKLQVDKVTSSLARIPLEELLTKDLPQYHLFLAYDYKLYKHDEYISEIKTILERTFIR